MTQKQTRKTSKPEPTTIRSRVDAVPQWLQAIAAIATVILSAAVVFGLVNRGSDPTVPTGSASAGLQAPRVTIEAVTLAASEVSASGSFEEIDAATETVLFIGQPTGDTAANWLPVVATLTPSASDTSGRYGGRWTASRPLEETVPYTWYAVVAPKAAGAGDALDDIRDGGPQADIIAAASEAYRTGD